MSRDHSAGIALVAAILGIIAPIIDRFDDDWLCNVVFIRSVHSVHSIIASDLNDRVTLQLFPIMTAVDRYVYYRQRSYYTINQTNNQTINHDQSID